MAGMDISIKDLAEMLDIGFTAASMRFKTGKFTRRDLAVIAARTGATPEQMQKAFFTNEEGKFMTHVTHTRSKK